jgi:hypothetical protein
MCGLFLLRLNYAGAYFDCDDAGTLHKLMRNFWEQRECFDQAVPELNQILGV